MKRIDITTKPEISFGTEFKDDLNLLFQNKILNGSKLILIMGIKSFKQREEYQILKRILLEKTNIDLVSEVYVSSNPTWDDIVKLEKSKEKIDTILCIGGGSVIDFGKALKLHFYKNAKIFVVYTLPGSASIVTPFVIFDNNEFKIGEHSIDIVPDYVYINENIILSAPPELVQLGTFDVLAHAIESFISKSATNESRVYALKSVHFLDAYLRSDSSSVLSLIKADIFAGLSEQVGLVLFPHAAGHYLTYKYRIPHSLATMYFLKDFLERLELGGLELPQEMLELLNIINRAFVNKFKKPILFTTEDAELSFKMSEKYMSFMFNNNPVPLSKEDYLTLYCKHENFK